MELSGIALGVQSVGSYWLLVLPLTGYRECVDVYAWMLACTHPVSFVGPVSTFEEDVTHCLTPKVTFAFIGVGLVDGMEVTVQADLACAHLCNDRANRSVRGNMCSMYSFSWPNLVKSSLPCSAVSRDSSHSSLIV